MSGSAYFEATDFSPFDATAFTDTDGWIDVTAEQHSSIASNAITANLHYVEDGGLPSGSVVDNSSQTYFYVEFTVSIPTFVRFTANAMSDDPFFSAAGARASLSTLAGYPLASVLAHGEFFELPSSVDIELLLSPGQYRIQASIRGFDEFSTGIGAGWGGDVSLSLTVIPAPSALALALIGAPVIVRRRR